MVIGILLAGGIGQRMSIKLPKQFLEVNGKPIICYPLDVMEQHPQIDVVEIVCVNGYFDIVWEIVRQNRYQKVKWVTAGGGNVSGIYMEWVEKPAK